MGHDDDDPTLTAERLRVLTKRFDDHETVERAYLRNAAKVVMVAVGYVLWGPFRHLLELAGFLQ